MHTVLTQDTYEDESREKPSTKITIMEMRVDQIVKIFDLSLSNTNTTPSQLCFESSCLPIPSSQINQIQCGFMGRKAMLAVKII